MKNAQKRARQIIRKYNLSTAPIDLNKIIDSEFLTLDEWELKGRVKEVYVGDSIGILQNATPRKKRELIGYQLSFFPWGCILKNTDTVTNVHFLYPALQL